MSNKDKSNLTWGYGYILGLTMVICILALRGKEMNNVDKSNLTWEYGYMLGITLGICYLALFLNSISLLFIIISFILVIGFIVIIWTKPLSKNLLYCLNILNTLGSVFLAYLINTVLIKSIDNFFVMINIIIVMDVVSFTKRGKITPNAKLMRNNNSLARLSICLPVVGKPGLQPIIGVGDLYFYSAILLFSLHTFGMNVFGKIFLLILLGQSINIIVISIIRNKTWYKGFPATLSPGILYLIFSSMLI